jgi:hypothetical protein
MKSIIGQAGKMPAIIFMLLFTSVMAKAQEKSLYERLGGYEAISAVVDDFAEKIFNNSVVGKRFFSTSKDSRDGFKQKNKNLICAVTGGPCKVISRDAKTAHGGLGIKACCQYQKIIQHLCSLKKQQQNRPGFAEQIKSTKNIWKLTLPTALKSSV